MESKIVIVHSDKHIRRALEALCSVHHEPIAVRDVKAGLKMILKISPALAVVGLDSQRKEALQLLRYMKSYGSVVPVIVVAGRGAGALQMQAMKAGAKGFLEYPVDQSRIDREISRVLQTTLDVTDSIPPITEEEANTNRTEMERTLNRRMKCHVGKNQVYLRSLIIGLTKTKPRITLKCALRTDFNMQSQIYYEYIRDVCCNDPSACPAMQQFAAKNSA